MRFAAAPPVVEARKPSSGAHVEQRQHRKEEPHFLCYRQAEAATWVRQLAGRTLCGRLEYSKTYSTAAAACGSSRRSATMPNAASGAAPSSARGSAEVKYLRDALSHACEANNTRAAAARGLQADGSAHGAHQ